MKTKKNLIVLIVVMMFGAMTYAQEERIAQVSFIYPIGTGGVNAVSYSNLFSLNIIGGINGGVNGIELGSVFNVNRGNVNGAQLSGVCNLTSGSSNGLILSGVANVTLQESKGAMTSGVLNTSKSHDGTLITGVANIVQDSSKGSMVSGVFNTSKSHDGVLLSGVSNVIRESSNGAIISGVLNYSGSHKGLQLSTINIASKKMDGAQIGVINVSNKSKGTQFGVINIANEADSIIPIGIINVVKGGYFAFELSSNELLLSNLSYKMGVEKFHTIFRVGIGMSKNKEHISTGMGFGSIIKIKDNHKLNIELLCDQLIYNNNWEGNLNLLNQLNLNYQYQISDFLSVKAGPSLRNYVTDQKINGEFNTLQVPYTISETIGETVKTSTWIGFNTAIVISI
jgi:hypothetical protein